METVVFSILGLKQTEQSDDGSGYEEQLIELIIKLRLEARQNKDYKTSDLIRDRMAEMGILLKDTKEGTSWEKA